MISILYLILGLAVVGFILWLITTYIPMPEIFKNVIIVIAVIALIFYLLNHFGILSKL